MVLSNLHNCVDLSCLCRLVATFISECSSGSHMILQPYQNRWLTTIDGLLLMDALFVYSLLEQQIPDEKGLEVYKVFLAYLLVLLPFLYIFLGIVFIVAQRTGFLGHVMRTIRQIKSIAAKKSKKTLVTTTEVSVSELINNDKTTELLLSSFGSNGGKLHEPFLEEVNLDTAASIHVYILFVLFYFLFFIFYFYFLFLCFINFL